MYKKIKIRFLFIILLSIFPFFIIQAIEHAKIVKGGTDKGRQTVIFKEWVIYKGGAAQDLIDHKDVYRDIHEPIFIQRVSALDAIENYKGEVLNHFGSSLIIKEDNN